MSPKHISNATYSSQSSRVNLVIQLVGVNFGPIVATLIRHLLFKGPTSYLDLVSTYGRVNLDHKKAMPRTKTVSSSSIVSDYQDNRQPFNHESLLKDPSHAELYTNVGNNTTGNASMPTYSGASVLIDDLLSIEDTFVELTGNTHTKDPDSLYGIRKRKFLIKEIQISMIMMIRHRFVQWTEDENHIKTFFVDIDHTLSALLFGGIFMDSCFDKWSELGSIICKEFIANGQLKYYELVDRVMENESVQNSEEFYSKRDLRDSISHVFDDMLGSRLLKRIETVDNVVKRVQQEIREEKEREERELEELMSRKKMKKAKTVEEQLGIDGNKTKRRRKAGVNESDTNPDLRSAVAKATRKRKKELVPMEDPESLDWNNQHNFTFNNQTPNSLNESSLLFDDEEFDSFKGKHGKDKIKDVIWVLNFDQFIRNLRKKRIVDYVAGKYDENSAVIVDSILTLSESYQKSRNDPQTKPVQFDVLAGHIQRMYANRVTISSRSLDTLLEGLVRQSLVERVSSQERGTFRVNMAYVIRTIKEHYLESIVHKKLGPIATRVFRMLLIKKYMEQKSIADEAMVAASEARKQLYHLMQHGFVNMQEVPKGNDRNNPLRTIFLWHVEVENVNNMILENMYETISKIRDRLESEQRRILDKVGIGNNAHLFKTLTFSDDQNRMLAELKRVEDLLEISMIRLSHMIILYQFF